VGRENRTVRYQSGTVRRSNPAFEALLGKIATASAATQAADDEQKTATALLDSLKALGYAKGDGTPRQGEVEYQTKLAAATVRANRAGEMFQRARDAEIALKQEAGTIPRDIEEPVWAEHVLTITSSTKTAQITAHVELKSGDRSLLSQDVSAAAQHKETVSDGFPPGGIPADPDETPDDAAMAVLAADRFSAIAAGRVRTAAADAARDLLVDARRAESAGKRDAAAEGYAMYLLSTSDAASPERADAARALEELLGVHVALRTGATKEEP
jgi:hypothetical protein